MSAFETVTPDPGPDPVKPAKLTLSVTRAGKVSFTAPGPGRASVTFKLRGRSVGSASKTVKAAGKVTLKVKLKKRSRGKATVKVTFKPAAAALRSPQARP